MSHRERASLDKAVRSTRRLAERPVIRALPDEDAADREDELHEEFEREQRARGVEE